VGRERYTDTHPSASAPVAIFSRLICVCTRPHGNRLMEEFDQGGCESQTRGEIAGEESIDRTRTAGRGWTARAREEEKMEIGPGIGRFWFF
jgi:hypothetical protein